MGRMIFAAGCWFALWMTLGAVVGGLTANPHGGLANGVYFGAFNGAWFAVLSSFAWPFIMPRTFERWLDNKI